MTDIYNKALEAREYINNKVKAIPKIAIILGTGLGGLIDEIEDAVAIPYGEIPHFPISTVESHKGELIIGQLKGKSVMVMAGRFHYYEGYTAKEITFPIRVMQVMGIRDIIITNVSGGLNPHFAAGQIVVVTDHINLIPDHPLRGLHDDRLGWRFPDMKSTYDIDKITLAHEAANAIDYSLKEGVYVALQGPSLETPAELRYMRKIGADLVGMSTVPEVIVANQAGMSILVLSMVSNVCYPTRGLEETSLDDVVETARQASPGFRALVAEVVGRMDKK